MIAALMQQAYRSGTPLKDHEIAHIMIAILMAGQHTSSASGSWALLHLAANPEVAYVMNPFSSILMTNEIIPVTPCIKNKSSTSLLLMASSVQ